MGSKDVFYSWDVDTGEIVGKTRFNDNGTIDKWSGINEKGYGHEKYSNSDSYAKQESGDIYSRSIGEDPDRTWSDRDGVFEPEDSTEKDYEDGLMDENNEYDVEDADDIDTFDDGEKMEESEISDDIDESDIPDTADIADSGEQGD